jgi:hypothetical protein
LRIVFRHRSGGGGEGGSSIQFTEDGEGKGKDPHTTLVLHIGSLVYFSTLLFTLSLSTKSLMEHFLIRSFMIGSGRV